MRFRIHDDLWMQNPDLGNTSFDVYDFNRIGIAAFRRSDSSDAGQAPLITNALKSRKETAHESLLHDESAVGFHTLSPRLKTSRHRNYVEGSERR